MVTERDIAVLSALRRYYVLTRHHLQRLCFPSDATGRVTRRRLTALLREKLISRSRTPVFNFRGGSAYPVYWPAHRGNEILAAHFDDSAYLLTPTQTPQPHHLLHWLAVTDFHITLDEAVALQNRVSLGMFFNEWDTVTPSTPPAANPNLQLTASDDQPRPERRYRIFTVLREKPRLVCAPDAAFLLEVGEHKKVFYLEMDRGTSGVRQIAASKTPGYAELANQSLHVRHFSDATVPTFSVLTVTPTASRRDALRWAVRNKPGAEFWKFVATDDLTAKRFLHATIFYGCDGGPTPLVKAA